MTWNEKLKQLRIEKNLSQQQAADLLKTTRSCYANYEQGIREPSFDMLVKLCDLFEVPADYIIGRIDGY